MRLVERPFSVAEALAASEAFSTSASAFVMPVVEVDGQAIGSGSVGPVAGQAAGNLYRRVHQNCYLDGREKPGRQLRRPRRMTTGA